jgi:CBS-domain-containing membrane protein
MHETYAPLTAYPMDPGTTFVLPERPDLPPVKLEDPAIRVMTDLRQVRALTASPGVSMDASYQRMRVNGVRMLLVVDERNVIVGLISTNDVEGERPVQRMHDRGIRREELRVADVMTPAARLEVIELRDVERACVGHVVASLKAMGRQHALVVERDPQGRQFLRGMFSATQIARQLGAPFRVDSIARSFADVEQALGR